MKTSTIFLLGLCCAATGILVWNLKPSPPAPDLYHAQLFEGTATIEYFNEGEWWAEMRDKMLDKVLDKCTQAVLDSLRNIRPIGEDKPLDIQAYPFSVKHESFEIEGTAFGVNVVAVQIQRLKAIGTAAVTVTPQGDIQIKPNTSGLSVSIDPPKVNLHKWKLHPWILFGASTAPSNLDNLQFASIQATAVIGFELRGFMFGGGMIGQGVGLTVGRKW